MDFCIIESACNMKSPKKFVEIGFTWNASSEPSPIMSTANHGYILHRDASVFLRPSHEMFDTN